MLHRAQLSVRRCSRPFVTAAKISRIAILIDADNVPARLAGPILEEVHANVEGIAIDRRVYGDFSSELNHAWKLASLEFGIETKMQTSPSKRKNATDIALAVDAMDILHTVELIDTFVIVTNDSDFAPLAQRLRRSGKRVVAVGSGSSLMASCDAFVHIEWSRDQPLRQVHVAMRNQVGRRRANPYDSAESLLSTAVVHRSCYA